MKVTSAFNFVTEVIVCDKSVSYVLRSPDGKPLFISDNVLEVADKMEEFVSEILDSKSVVK